MVEGGGDYFPPLHENNFRVSFQEGGTRTVKIVNSSLTFMSKFRIVEKTLMN